MMMMMIDDDDDDDDIMMSHVALRLVSVSLTSPPPLHTSQEAKDHHSQELRARHTQPGPKFHLQVPTYQLQLHLLLFGPKKNAKKHSAVFLRKLRQEMGEQKCRRSEGEEVFVVCLTSKFALQM